MARKRDKKEVSLVEGENENFRDPPKIELSRSTIHWGVMAAWYSFCFFLRGGGVGGGYRLRAPLVNYHNLAGEEISTIMTGGTVELWAV